MSDNLTIHLHRLPVYQSTQQKEHTSLLDDKEASLAEELKVTRRTVTRYRLSLSLALATTDAALPGVGSTNREDQMNAAMVMMMAIEHEGGYLIGLATYSRAVSVDEIAARARPSRFQKSSCVCVPNGPGVLQVSS